jgi:hypothetical protein
VTVIRRKALKDAGAWSGLPGGAQGIAQALETRAINAEVEATRLRQQLKGAVEAERDADVASMQAAFWRARAIELGADPGEWAKRDREVFGGQ